MDTDSTRPEHLVQSVRRALNRHVRAGATSFGRNRRQRHTIACAWRDRSAIPDAFPPPTSRTKPLPRPACACNPQDATRGWRCTVPITPICRVFCRRPCAGDCGSPCSIWVIVRAPTGASSRDPKPPWQPCTPVAIGSAGRARSASSPIRGTPPAPKKPNGLGSGPVSARVGAGAQRGLVHPTV